MVDSKPLLRPRLQLMSRLIDEGAGPGGVWDAGDCPEMSGPYVCINIHNICIYVYIHVSLCMCIHICICIYLYMLYI